MSLQDLYVVRPTDLPYQLPNSNCYISSQNRLAVLRDEYKVIMQ